jgi:hypothetical protein
MQVQVDAAAFLADLRRATRAEADRVFAAVDESVKEATTGLKEELRDQTFKVLGRRVAYAWQSRHYPNKGQAGGPAGFVWTKAPRIIDFFRAERVVTPLGNAFAIPVASMVKRGGRTMSVHEVEQQLGQRLQAHRLPSGLIGLFANLVRGRNGRGFRPDTPGRRAQGRKPELTLMFVLVRNLKSRKLIDLDGPANRWAGKVPQLVEQKLGSL